MSTKRRLSLTSDGEKNKQKVIRSWWMGERWFPLVGSLIGVGGSDMAIDATERALEVYIFLFFPSILASRRFYLLSGNLNRILTEKRRDVEFHA